MAPLRRDAGRGLRQSVQPEPRVDYAASSNRFFERVHQSGQGQLGVSGQADQFIVRPISRGSISRWMNCASRGNSVQESVPF